MSNCLIAIPTLSDAAEITASSAVAAGPVANLQRTQPTDVWRSAVLTPYIEIDLGTVTAFNLVALLFSNATQAATWRLRMADTQVNLTAAPDYDSGAVDFSPWDTDADRRHGFWFDAAGRSQRWIRIDISDSGNADGVFQAGRLYVADAYQPTVNYVYGAAFGFIDASSRERTQVGNAIVNRVQPIPTLTFDLIATNETEFYNNTYRIQMLRGAARDVLAIMDPADVANGHHKIVYGLLAPTLRTVQPRYNQWAQRYEIEGMI